MSIKRLYADLSLFDGDGGGASAASATGDGGSASTGDTQGTPGNTRSGKKKGEFDGIKFGKQDAVAVDTSNVAKAKDSVAENQDATASPTLEERKKKFEDLINGEYKDIYTEKTQGMISKRFKEVKALEDASAKTKPIVDMLMQRYNITDGDMDKLTKALDNDDMYWSLAAEEAGMSVENFKELQKLKRENAVYSEIEAKKQQEQQARDRVQGWIDEAEALKATYPDFNLESESSDPRFMEMLRRGVPVEHAYKIKYFDRLMTDATQTAAKDAEKRTLDNVRAKGARPAENGVSPQSAFTVMDDPSKWNKQHRAEVAKRVLRGEKIIL